MGDSFSLNRENVRIGLIGLGYVGLPLAIAFARTCDVVGFDVNEKRVQALCAGVDNTNEVSQDALQTSNVHFTSCLDEKMHACNCYIVTVPTPVDAHKNPDMSFLEHASEMVGSCLVEGDVVVYESTVYPGATGTVCVPILERASGLSLNKGFWVGYSPERINPGDKENRLECIKKVVAGSDSMVSHFLGDLYGSIITAGIHMAPSIEVAEAAKVIENVQRDINIGLINELSCLFDLMDIDTQSVLEAANTKWNFLNFQPGLVGGHCIGVDPYYLTYKASSLGFCPQMVLAGRKVNDDMFKSVVDRVLRLMVRKKVDFLQASVLLMGYVFKENCPDSRNTQVKKLVQSFASYGLIVEVYDPWVLKEDRPSNVLFVDELSKRYEAVVLTVAHDCFKKMGREIASYKKDRGVLFDVKGILDADLVDGRL